LEGLSDEAITALGRLYNDLPPEQRDAYREQARENLEDAEDLLQEELALLSADEPFEAHADRRDRQVAGSRDAGRHTREAKLLDELEAKFIESLEPYERARMDVIGQVDNLYDRMRRLLMPDETDASDYGYPTGQRLDLTRVMPAEHDFEQKRRLFIRETEPGRRDYAFYHLVDLSGSMGGQKIRETQKGFIVTAEACDRLMDYNSSELTLRQGFAGFHDNLHRMMALGERLTTSRKNRITRLPSSISGSTNTLVATQHALQQLLEAPGETANFLLTFSDGHPNYDIRDRLRGLITGSREEREAHRLSMGLILLGDTEDQKELDTMLEAYGYDFGLCLPTIGRRGEGGRDFSELLADLLEELVENTVTT
jgi:von Willebrand factor type A domain-containing protein